MIITVIHGHKSLFCCKNSPIFDFVPNSTITASKWLNILLLRHSIRLQKSRISGNFKQISDLFWFKRVFRVLFRHHSILLAKFGKLFAYFVPFVPRLNSESCSLLQLCFLKSFSGSTQVKSFVLRSCYKRKNVERKIHNSLFVICEIGHTCVPQTVLGFSQLLFLLHSVDLWPLAVQIWQ